MSETQLALNLRSALLALPISLVGPNQPYLGPWMTIYFLTEGNMIYLAVKAIRTHHCPCPYWGVGLQLRPDARESGDVVAEIKRRSSIVGGNIYIKRAEPQHQTITKNRPAWCALFSFCVRYAPK